MAATAALNNERFQEAFVPLLAERNEPEVISARRRAALQQFETLGLPTKRQESWRFTDLGALATTHLQRAIRFDVDAALLPPPPAADCHRLVFVNGRFAPRLSRLNALPDEALVASMGQALLTHPELVEAALARPSGPQDHPFAALNTAFWEDGAFIYLPRQVVLEAPLHLIYFASGDGTANYPRNLIVLGEAAQATIVEDYCGEGGYLTCPVTEISCATGAVLAYHKIQQDGPAGRHLGVLRLHQERASRANTHFFSGGGLLTRTDVLAQLDGAEAECGLNGLSLVADGQLADYHVRVEHARPHGSSRQLFKSVLEGKSRTVFDGVIKVHQDAQKTDASQNNRNLLLSRRALANTNPRLEILADDVKCSHGATVGFLDRDALFYLRSRGIGAAEARSMLVYAFANDSIAHIPLVALRERLEKLLVNRLYSNALEGQS